MQFDFETIPATFVARPNRFVVEARLDDAGQVVRCHCADPGRMRELLVPGVPLHLSKAASAGRKTAFDLRFVECPLTGQLVSVDSRLPNRLFAEAVGKARIKPLADFQIERCEVPAPLDDDLASGVRSRIDFVLRSVSGDRMWLEVKSAAMVANRVAYFPDARTERGRRHVLELTRLREAGVDRAAIVFIVQRADADALRPQWDIDPAFAAALQEAQAGGVELYAFTCKVTRQEISVDRRIAVVVSPDD